MAVKPSSTSGRVAFLRRAEDGRLDPVAQRLSERGFVVDFYADEQQTARGVEQTPTDLLVVTHVDRHAFDQDRFDTPMLVLPKAPQRHAPELGGESMTGMFVSAIERIFADREPATPPVHGRMQQLASLGLVASGVAHELSTPLSSLWMDLNTLQRALTDEPALQDSLNGAFDAVERMRQIIVDVRELSRSETAGAAHTDVRGVLDRAIRLLRPRLLHSRVERDYLPTPLVTAGDGRLDQLFINLLSNAADAMEEEDPEGHNQIRITTRTGPEGSCVVEVADNGCGIKATDLPHIFDTFFTTKPASRGTGLGLPLCHGVVASLGGTIDVESTVSVGTTFRVTLPGRKDLGRRKTPPRGV